MTDWSKLLATGVQVPSGSPIPQRKDISTLNDVEKYLLFEGLARFQNDRDPTREAKWWYQIAGIHGLPYQAWPPGNKEVSRKDPNGFGGYCTHSSILFLTWHRPYLALFESILVEHVQAVANGIDDRDTSKKTYVDASKTFRLPYWDWAKKDTSNSYFPLIALTKGYKKFGPSSTASWFDKNPNSLYNPLYQAPFPNGIDGTFGGIVKGGGLTTWRNPGSGRAPQGPKERVEEDFNDTRTDSDFDPRAQPKNISERVAYIVKSYQRYASMSNNVYRNSGDQKAKKAEIWGSFEDFHNTIHGDTGGSKGHMGFPETSAFDPIFWLHHANIDRLFAIWQALHSSTKDDTDDPKDETWVTSQVIQVGDMGNWTKVPGDTEDATTPLYPFRFGTGNGQWYTSERKNAPKQSVKRTEPFGYTYPETAGLTYPVSDTARGKLVSRIDTYYNSASTEILQSRMGNPDAGAQFLPQASLLKQLATSNAPATHEEKLRIISQIPEQHVLLKQSIGPDKPFLKDLAPNNTYLEWLVNIKAQKHVLGGRYSVNVFLGPVEEDNVSLWRLSPQFVGNFVPFGQPSATGCAKCQDDQSHNLQITSQIPLTIALIERYLAGILPDISAETVVPYLTKNLHWRVESGGSIVQDRSQVAGLTVFVVSNKVTLPETETELPIYDDDVTIYPEITTNLNGDGRGDGTGLTAGEQ